VLISLLLPVLQTVWHAWIVWRMTRPQGTGSEGQGARRLARLLAPLGALLPVVVAPVLIGVSTNIAWEPGGVVAPLVAGVMLAAAVVVASLEPLRRHLRRVFKGDAQRTVLRPLHRAMTLFGLQGALTALVFLFLRAETVTGLSPTLTPAVVTGLSALIAMATGIGGWLMILRLGVAVARLPVPEPGGTTPRLTRWLRALQEPHGLDVVFQDAHAGFTAEGRLDGLPATLWVDLSRHPASGELVVHMPAFAASHPRLLIRARDAGEPPGVPLADAILSRLIRVRGVSPAVANALVADLHDPLLDVVQGLPGSALRAGRLVVPLTLRPGEPQAGVDLDDAIMRAVGLSSILEARAAG
jgi:hypothetical protein